MLKREIISRKTKYYKVIKFRWVLYVLIISFFLQKLILTHTVKTKHQKEYFALMEKAQVLQYDVNYPKWINYIPKRFKSYFNSWSSYTINLFSSRVKNLSCLEDLSYFDNITALHIDESQSYYNTYFIQKCKNLTFQYASKIQNLEELHVSTDFLNKEELSALKGSKLKSLNIFSQSLSKGCLEIIGSIKPLTKLSIAVEGYLPFEEFRHIQNPVLTDLSISLGVIASGGAFTSKAPLINYFTPLKKLKVLGINSSLSCFVRNIEKFPNLETLYVNNYIVNDDEQISKLIKHKSLNISGLEIGLGVTQKGMKHLSKIKGLQILDLTKHRDLSKINFNSFPNKLHVTFPAYFDIKTFIQKNNQPLNIKTLYCPGTNLDLKTVKIIKNSGISGILEEENSYTKETLSYLKQHSMVEKSNRKISRRKAYFSGRFYSLKNNKKITEDLIVSAEHLMNFEDKSITVLSLSFNHFSKDAAMSLLTFDKLEILNLNLYSGMENLNYLNEHESLKSIEVKFFTPPKEALDLEKIERLLLNSYCNASFQTLIDPEKFNKLIDLSISTNEIENKGMILNGIQKLESLRKIELSGYFKYHGSPINVDLENFNFVANELQILQNIAPINNLGNFSVYLDHNNTEEQLKALLSYPNSIRSLYLNEISVTEKYFELIPSFRNLEYLRLPNDRRTISFKVLREILHLPNLVYLDLGAQKFTQSEFNQLTEKEIQKLQ